MMPIEHNLIRVAASLVRHWVIKEYDLWPVAGLAFGFALGVAIFAARGVALRFVLAACLILFGFQFGLAIVGPSLLQSLFHVEWIMPTKHIVVGVFGTLVGCAVAFGIVRVSTRTWERLRERFTSRTAVQRTQRSDMRYMARHVPSQRRPFDPRKYIAPKRGVFLGLGEDRKALYVPADRWYTTHAQICGPTGSGKGVLLGSLLYQSIRQGTSVAMFDPKNDEWLPHVLMAAANEAGVPYMFIDLAGNIPQWSPFAGKDEFEIQELLAAAFGMSDQGSDADYYRAYGRRVARTLARDIAGRAITPRNAYLDRVQDLDKEADDAKKFLLDLEEICSLRVVCTIAGMKLNKAIEDGAVIYVRGSTRNPAVIRLQRMFLVAVVQAIEARRGDARRHTTICLDEFKYHISRPSLEALGAIRDKHANVLLAHQSLGDLRDGPKDLDADSVGAIVQDNCGIKIAYGTKSYETADHFAKLSGTILVDDEIRTVSRNAALAESKKADRVLRQAERHLIDANMMLSLPPLCAALYGAGTPQLIFTSPVRVERNERATRPTLFELNEWDTVQGTSRPPKRPASLSGELIDVD